METTNANLFYFGCKTAYCTVDSTEASNFHHFEKNLLNGLLNWKQWCLKYYWQELYLGCLSSQLTKTMVLDRKPMSNSAMTPVLISFDCRFTTSCKDSLCVDTISQAELDWWIQNMVDEGGHEYRVSYLIQQVVGNFLQTAKVKNKLIFRWLGKVWVWKSECWLLSTARWGCRVISRHLLRSPMKQTSVFILDQRIS